MKPRQPTHSTRTTGTEFLEPANDGAKAAGTLHIAFVGFLAYFGSIIWSTTHVDLLRNTPIQLPILQVKLSLFGFFQYVPWLVVLLHFNLLLQLYLLSRKLWLLDPGGTTSSPSAHFKRRLFNFPFAHYLLASERSLTIRVLLGLAVGISMIAFPLFILVYAQVTFLPFHDESVTWWMRIAVWADVLILLILWPRLSAPTDRWRDWWRLPMPPFSPGAYGQCSRPTRETSRLLNGMLLVFAVCCAMFLSTVALIPAGALRPLSIAEYRRANIDVLCDVEAVESIVDEDALRPAQEERIRKHCDWLPAFSLEAWFADVMPEFLLTKKQRHFEPTGQTLLATAWLFDDEGAPWRRDLALRDERLLSERTPVDALSDLKSRPGRYVQSGFLRKALGITLRGRDLRRADLTGVVLIAADLRDAQLQGARLDSSSGRGEP